MTAMLPSSQKIAVDESTNQFFPITRYGVGSSGDLYFFIAKNDFNGSLENIKVVLGSYNMGEEIKMVMSGRAIPKSNVSLARKIWSQSFCDTTEERFVQSNFIFLKVIDVSASIETK